MAKEFIILGNTRLKIKNIKDYGISSKQKTFYYLKIYEKNPNYISGDFFNNLFNSEYIYRGTKKEITEKEFNSLSSGDIRIKTRDVSCGDEIGDTIWDMIDIGNIIYTAFNKDMYILNDSGKIVKIDKGSFNSDDLITETRKVKYLYVTTYQNDNYTFTEGEENFNIFSKCKELDNLLTH